MAQGGVAARIDPGIGANSYTIGQQQIDNAPGGANVPFAQQLYRLPGVVQDSYGEIHIRAEHGNAQYQINGIMLPEGLEGFGQQFDTQFIKSATLLVGTLPAYYGIKNSGVIDITTKTGADLQGATAEVYGGSFGTIRPFYNIGGTSGKLDYFGSFSYNQNNLGIENPTSSLNALHDHTTQYNGFGGLIYHIDDHSRVSLFVGASNQQFQIPDIAGQQQLFSVADAPNIPSSALNENQNEQRYFGVLAYDLDLGRLTVRPSFESYDRLLYTPDYVGDLIYQGFPHRLLKTAR